MQIFVDADACPVVRIVERIAEKYQVPVTLLCDTNHVLYSEYSEVIVVGAGADAVDYKLISICHKGDIVVTQDYGVAAMALGKGAKMIIVVSAFASVRCLSKRHRFLYLEKDVTILVSVVLKRDGLAFY